MHQPVAYVDDEYGSYTAALERGGASQRTSRCTRRRAQPGVEPRGLPPGLGLAVLNCDPMLLLYRHPSLLSIKDLRTLVAGTGAASSPAIQCAARDRAGLRLAAAASTLRVLRGAWAARCAPRVAVLALDAEARLLQVGVPMNAVHPELSSPLNKEGEATPTAHFYAGHFSLGQVLRAATHPAAWAPQPAGLWDAVAESAGICMRPQLVLAAAALLPVEARGCYLALRHSAYSSPGVESLGDLVRTILLRMMLPPASAPAALPASAPQLASRRLRLAKQLRQVAPHRPGAPSPYSLWLLRQCGALGPHAAQLHLLPLAAQQQLHAAAAAALSASLDRLFALRGEEVLYSSAPWVPWLCSLPTTYLVAFHIKYLNDGFQ